MIHIIYSIIKTKIHNKLFAKQRKNKIDTIFAKSQTNRKSNWVNVNHNYRLGRKTRKLVPQRLWTHANLLGMP